MAFSETAILPRQPQALALRLVARVARVGDVPRRRLAQRAVGSGEGIDPRFSRPRVFHSGELGSELGSSTRCVQLPPPCILAPLRSLSGKGVASEGRVSETLRGEAMAVAAVRYFKMLDQDVPVRR